MKCQEIAANVRKYQEMSGNVTERHGMPRNVRKCHEMSRNVRKCQGMSGNTRRKSRSPFASKAARFVSITSCSDKFTGLVLVLRREHGEPIEGDPLLGFALRAVRLAPCLGCEALVLQLSLQLVIGSEAALARLLAQLLQFADSRLQVPRRCQQASLAAVARRLTGDALSRWSLAVVSSFWDALPQW